MMTKNLLEPKHFLISNRQVEYFDEGKGLPIVLIHGWLVSKESFYFLIKELLKENFRIIAPDMPGFGNSQELPTCHSPERYAQFLEIFLEKLKLKVIDLLGPSMGGTIALNFTLRNPKKVNRLVLQSPFFYGRQTWYKRRLRLMVPFTRLKPFREIVFRLAASFLEKQERKLTPKIARTYRPEFEKMTEIIGRFLLQTMSKRAAEEIGRYTTKIDFRPDLHTLRTKTLILIGEKDSVIKFNDMQTLSRLLVNSSLLVLPGGSHYVMVEKAKEFNRAVVNFLLQAN
jgi:branched-chain amino acid transport system permease protein